MAAGDGDSRLRHGSQVHGPLFLNDRRRGAERHIEHHVHAVGDAGVDTAGMIAYCANSAMDHRKWVVGRTAAHLGKGLPRAEADGLDGGNGKHVAGDGALHGIPPVRAAQTGRQTADGAADHAAHTVAIRFGSGSAHPQGLLVQDLRVHGDMDRLQVCDRQRAGHSQRRGEPPGCMAAAPGITAAQGADRGGVVSVGGPGLVFQAVVVGGTDITVVNDRRQRIAGGAALIDAG